MLYDLLLDWLGERVTDDGFDELLRETNAGAALAARFGAAFEGTITGLGQAAFVDAFARQTVPRTGTLLALAVPGDVRLTVSGGSGGLTAV